jgi:hypothetical protein
VAAKWPRVACEPWAGQFAVQAFELPDRYFKRYPKILIEVLSQVYEGVEV